MNYEEMIAMQYEAEEQKAQIIELAALETRADWGKEENYDELQKISG